MYSLWLSTKQERDKHKFAAARDAAQRAIRLAKEKWFLCKVEEVERGRHIVKYYGSVLAIFRGGLVPVRSTMVKDDKGNVCSSSGEQQEQWRRHLPRF